MIDFKPGDEVVCVQDESERWSISSGLTVGAKYTVTQVFEDKVGYDASRREVGVKLLEVAPPCPFSGFKAAWFRKIQRRNLTAWLATENTIEEPKRIRETESA